MIFTRSEASIATIDIKKSLRSLGTRINTSRLAPSLVRSAIVYQRRVNTASTVNSMARGADLIFKMRTICPHFASSFSK